MIHKPRILFVDDEPHLLQALQRSLRPMRTEWEMEFVDSGAHALARMAEVPFDMLVSDMKMPGMSGCELLDEVMVKHPATLRFILSGHAEQAQVMQCVGATHQFLSKPCATEKLTHSLLRMTALEALVPSPELRQLLARVDRIPCSPARREALASLLQSPQPAIEQVASVVAQDPGMTALILKLANSDFFGTSKGGLDSTLAATQFGVEVLQTLTITLGLLVPFPSVQCPAFDPRQFWPQSLDCASALRHRVVQDGLTDVKPTEAYVVGLLLDVGRLILASHLGHDYARITADEARNAGALTAAERRLFGVSHAEVGAYLLGMWGLPDVLVETVAYHHDAAPRAVRHPALLQLARAISDPTAADTSPPKSDGRAAA